MARVFISHSSKDGEQAARMLEWLRAQGFEGAFLDFDQYAGIPPGADWERTLYREIAHADAIILILTANWFASKWCFAEYTQARALGKAIFPLIESPEGETFVAPDIQHLDLRKDRTGGLARLSAELTRIALDSRGEFAWDTTRPPFPGLLAYDEADAAIYFGRDDDTPRLIERLNARRAQGGANMVALLGASGSGKSSLMRAGVLPRLKRDRRNWIVLPPFRPQSRPLDELAQAIAQALGPKGDWRKIRETLLARDLDQSLSDLARDLRASHSANAAQILISIDQGEELFGTADQANAERFWTVLNMLLDEHLPFIVLLGLRSDYLGQLQQVPGLTAPFEEFSLKPMPLERVRDIIEGPARIAGLNVDNALVTATMKDAATEDALPLLAFALRELYDRSARSDGLTIESYRALGDEKVGISPLENAVRRRADEVLAAARPTPEQLQALKDAFIPAMVRVNTEGEYARRPARFDWFPAPARLLIERLVNARLLTRRQEDGDTVVEVAHEALLRKWPLLRGWLDEEREFLIGKQQLEQDLHDWNKAADTQKPETLLSGLKLTRAREWLVNHPRQLTTAECEFINASIFHHEELQRKAQDALIAHERLVSAHTLSRRTTFGMIAVSALASCAAGGAYWAYNAEKKFRDEQERRRNAEKDSLRRAVLEESMRIDIEGQLIAFSGSKGYEEGSQPGSLYTRALIAELVKDISFRAALQNTNQQVSIATALRQRPYMSTDMNGDIFLHSQPETRLISALVVSNSRFSGINDWVTPQDNAALWAELFKHVNIRYEMLQDPDRAALYDALERQAAAFQRRGSIDPKWPVQKVSAPSMDLSFQRSANSNSLAIFVYSGFGVQINGENLLPLKFTDNDRANMTYELIKERSATLTDISEKSRENAAASILIIDAYPRGLDRLILQLFRMR